MDQAVLRDRLACAYSSGALGAGLSLLVEARAALSAPEAAHLAIAEGVAGAFLEMETPVPLGERALAHVFDQIAARVEAEEKPRAPLMHGAFGAEIMALPAPVRSAALEALAHSDWAFGGPGIRILPLKLEDDARVELIRLEPGFATPRHTHVGDEYTLVLTGAFHDGLARYGVGDVSFADTHITHRPRAEVGAVCYNLAVSEGSLLFTGLLGAAQKMWRQ